MMTRELTSSSPASEVLLEQELLPWETELCLCLGHSWRGTSAAVHRKLQATQQRETRENVLIDDREKRLFFLVITTENFYTGTLEPDSQKQLQFPSCTDKQSTSPESALVSSEK